MSASSSLAERPPLSASGISHASGAALPTTLPVRPVREVTAKAASTKRRRGSFRSRYGHAMSRSAEIGSSPSPVTADDLDLAVQLAVAVLREAPPAAWDGKAGSLEWDCWETVEHLSDDLFAYAAQLGPKAPPLDGDVPFVWESRRPGG